jgi:pimeloyl-ACP methyl ester carboxylesterase
MIQRPLHRKLEIQNEIQAQELVSHILNWVVYGLPYDNNPLLSHKTKAERQLLLQALRQRLQRAFTELAAELNQRELRIERREKLKLLQAYLLAFYPYSEPEADDRLYIAHEGDEQQWKLIEYRIQRLDLTPQTGFLATLFKTEDRLHAYALESEEADPYLLFMGTPFPINHGSQLGMLHNFSWRLSPGEAHDRTQVNAWLTKQKNVTVIGHSQGAVNALIIAAEHAATVRKAFCFCPAKLYQGTLDRLLPQWEKAPLKPELQVYTPENDLVFAFGSGFLPGTQLFKMVYDRKSTRFRDIHIPSGIGCDSFQLIDLKKNPQRSTLKEELFSSAATIGSPLIFMARYLKLYNKLLADKYGHRYLAPLALAYLGTNWLLFKKLFPKTPLYWSLLLSFLLVQRSSKAARTFWQLAQSLGVVLGALYALTLIGPKKGIRLLTSAASHSPGSSANILAVLKTEASAIVERHSPLTPLKQLGENLVSAQKFYTQAYQLWEQEKKNRSSGLLPYFDESPNRKAYSQP